MVECGVARKLDTFSDNFPGPLKTKYELTHPEMCLVLVDEVGRNISQRGGRHIGGKTYFCENGSTHQNKASHIDRHFTLLCFTALTGKPVICVVIVSGAAQDHEVDVGINIKVTVIGDPSSDSDYLKRIEDMSSCSHQVLFVNSMVR